MSAIHAAAPNGREDAVAGIPPAGEVRVQLGRAVERVAILRRLRRLAEARDRAAPGQGCGGPRRG